MPTRLNAYLSFDGNCEDAMKFYKDVLGGELNLNYFSDFPSGDGPAPKGVMHAMLETQDGMVLMASDMPPGVEGGGAPSGMSLSLSGDDGSALRGYWDKLNDSGSITMPLEPQMWGDTFGMCTDKFGIQWMVNIVKVPVSV